MSAEVSFISKSGTPDAECLGYAFGTENALSALSYTDDKSDTTLSVEECLSLISSLADKSKVDNDLAQKLEEISKDDLIRVSIDY